MKIDFDSLKLFRQSLHANPEVSGSEKHTADSVLGYIKNFNPTKLITGLGGHGILATWDSGIPGPELMFRSELDALPIREINTFGYKSRINGVSHKCGHDGHTTILCALAMYLSQAAPKKGKIHLLFQPAEENGEGAAAVLADKKFSLIKPDYVFALHNLPGFPIDQIVIKEGIFTAAVTSIIITLDGKTSHAAEPENGINPALAVAEILKQSVLLEKNIPDDKDMSVVTPVFIELGEKAYGISAGHASVHLTIRCWNDENLKSICNQIESLSSAIAVKQKLKISFDYTQTFHANNNHSSATKYVRDAAVNSKMSVVEKPFPFKWGEDFGLFTAGFKGCMFGLGAGETVPALHNPDYDFPDELIKSGLTIFKAIINEFENS